jgi:hypothetical protein
MGKRRGVDGAPVPGVGGSGSNHSSHPKDNPDKCAPEHAASLESNTQKTMLSKIICRPAGIKAGSIHIRAFMADSSATSAARGLTPSFSRP